MDVEKPEGWLDDGPEFIPDPESSKPEDWYVHKSLSNEGTGAKGEGGVLGSALQAVLLVVCMTRLFCGLCFCSTGMMKWMETGRLQ